jgi:hypothetical protein
MAPVYAISLRDLALRADGEADLADLYLVELC